MLFYAEPFLLLPLVAPSLVSALPLAQQPTAKPTTTADITFACGFNLTACAEQPRSTPTILHHREDAARYSCPPGYGGYTTPVAPATANVGAAVLSRAEDGERKRTAPLPEPTPSMRGGGKGTNPQVPGLAADKEPGGKEKNISRPKGGLRLGVGVVPDEDDSDQIEGNGVPENEESEGIGKRQASEEYGDEQPIAIEHSNEEPTEDTSLGGDEKRASAEEFEDSSEGGTGYLDENPPATSGTTGKFPEEKSQGLTDPKQSTTRKSGLNRP
jgi:hypothetical protein